MRSETVSFVAGYVYSRLIIIRLYTVARALLAIHYN